MNHEIIIKNGIAGVDEMSDDIVLDFDVFAGDFGEPADSVLSNKMVVARKIHQCCNCRQPIQKGDRHRCQTSVFGELMTHRWCPECCAAMIKQELADDCESNPFDDRSGLFDRAERVKRIRK